MTAATATDALIPAPLATIFPAAVADFPLFIRDTLPGKYRLYRDKNIAIEQDDLDHLAERGVRNLYVSLEDHEHYQSYLRTNFQAILHDESLSTSRRCECLNEFVRSTLGEAFAGGDAGQAVDAAELLAFQTVDFISREDVTTDSLLNVLHHDYHTFTHSANVSYYCVMLARGLGIDGSVELRQIATGAMLHDMGKLNIPEAILKKRGRLSDEEFGIIKGHPVEGFRLLSQKSELNFAQLMMVYQHHERLDGSGYPVGVGESEIHPWAQLCAVVDIYEALTSNRPYRNGLSPEETFQILDREAGAKLNQRMCECWKTIIRHG